MWFVKFRGFWRTQVFEVVRWSPVVCFTDFPERNSGRGFGFEQRWLGIMSAGCWIAIKLAAINSVFALCIETEMNPQQMVPLQPASHSFKDNKRPSVFGWFEVRRVNDPPAEAGPTGDWSLGRAILCRSHSSSLGKDEDWKKRVTCVPATDGLLKWCLHLVKAIHNQFIVDCWEDNRSRIASFKRCKERARSWHFGQRIRFCSLTLVFTLQTQYAHFGCDLMNTICSIHLHWFVEHFAAALVCFCGIAMVKCPFLIAVVSDVFLTSCWWSLASFQLVSDWGQAGGFDGVVLMAPGRSNMEDIPYCFLKHNKKAGPPLMNP